MHVFIYVAWIVFSRQPSTSTSFTDVLDSKCGGVPKHSGQIADFMSQWEGSVAEHLELTSADVAHIKAKYPGELKLQS